MHIRKMSDEGAKQTVGQICDGLKSFLEKYPNSSKPLLQAMIGGFLEDLDQDDFFGTEGWEAGLGIE